MLKRVLGGPPHKGAQPLDKHSDKDSMLMRLRGSSDESHREFGDLLRFSRPRSPSQARDFVRLFPRLPTEAQGLFADDAFTMLQEWDQWWCFDVSEYVDALRLLLPGFSSEQRRFLWTRAVSESASPDGERVKFGRLSLAVIAPYLPPNEKHQLISELDLGALGEGHIVATLLLEKSLTLSDAQRRELQILAWQHASTPHAFSPLESTADIPSIAFGVTHPIKGETPRQAKWLDHFAARLDSDVIWAIWISYRAWAITGVSSRKMEFWEQVAVLSRVVPEDKIFEACRDCCTFHGQVGYFTDAADVLAILVNRLPVNEHAVAWEEIMHILTAEADSHVLAFWLTQKVSGESLRLKLYTELYYAIRQQFYRM